MTDQAGASRAEAEAARWFETLRQTSVTTAALREFHAWKKDAANAAAFDRVEAGWRAAGALRNHPDVQRETAALLARRPAKRRVDWRLIVAPVAVAGTLAGVSWVGVREVSPTYSTGVGEQQVAVLRDGSRVRLNTDSSVRVWYWGGTRRVYLQRGQAFFEVAHDPDRPFLVDAGPAEVRALGTKFDVRRGPDGVSVTLLEGRVRVESESGSSTELAPREQLRVTAAGVTPVRVAASEATSWTTGRLVFEGVPLREAVAEANRYSRRKIELAVPEAVAGEQVSGTFDAGDIDAVVAALTHYYHLEANNPSPDVIRLTPRT